MKFLDALTEVRRKIGVIKPYDKADLYWMCDKIVRENKKVFDALAGS